MESTFFISFGIIIIAATIMTYIFNRLKQPSVLAFILTGIIIGPVMLNLVSNTQEIILLSEIGIAFLLFSVGVSTEIEQIKKINVSVFLLPIINIVITLLFLLLFMNILPINFVQCLYLSFIISFSSTMLVAKLLLDKFEIGALHGKLAISILLIEDIIAIIAIPLLKNIAHMSLLLIITIIFKVIIFVILAYVLKTKLYPIIIKRTYKSDESFFLLSIASCFIFILISVLLDFPIAVGAFFGGLAISIFPYNLEVTNQITSIRDLLSMIFFVSLGMQLSFDVSSNWPFLLILLALIFLLKPLIHMIMLLFAGYGLKISSQTALDLAQVSEFSLILAMQGWTLGQIPDFQYNVIIIATSLSMLITPYVMKFHTPLYKYLKPLFKKFKSKKFSRKVDVLKNLPKKLENHIIIGGSDVIGEAIIKVLGRDEEIPMVVVDFDPDKIISLINKKANCICGDINYDEIINELNVSKAKLAVVTLPTFDPTVRFLKTAKQLNPNIKFYTRANTKEEAMKLYKLGADIVMMPSVLESNYILEKIHKFIKYGPERVGALKSEYLSYLQRDLEEDNNIYKKQIKKSKSVKKHKK